MRTEANGIAIPDQRRARRSGTPTSLADWRRYAKLRTQLYPYLAAADARVPRARGLPIMRHLALAYPDDPRATARDDEFLFGPDLLAAPVLDAGRDAAHASTCRAGAGSTCGARRATASATAALSLRPRARAARRPRGRRCRRRSTSCRCWRAPATLLPLLPPDVDTLAPYGDRAPDRLARRARAAAACCWPSRAGARRRALEDGGALRSREGQRALDAHDRLDAQSAPGRSRRRWARCARAVSPLRRGLDGRRLAGRAWDYAAAGQGVAGPFPCRPRCDGS